MGNLIKECIEKIYHANIHEELKTFFKEKNLNVTDTQLKNMINALAPIYKNPEELEKLKNITDDDLENIAGGKLDITPRDVWGLIEFSCILVGVTVTIVDKIKEQVAKKRKKQTKPIVLDNRNLHTKPPIDTIAAAIATKSNILRVKSRRK